MFDFRPYSILKSVVSPFKLIVVVGIIQFFSCTVTKYPIVFNGISKDTVLLSFKTPELGDIIQINDELDISISSLNPEMDDKFNNSGFSSQQSGLQNTYKVDSEGKIKFHHIGVINVAGLHLNQLINLLEKQLAPFYKDLLVNIKFANKNITVLGWVNNPKLVQFQNTPLTIFDALAQCGDLKSDADFRNILIFRDSSGVKKVGVINLQDNSVFNSKWFFLNPNDVVLVRKDEAKNLRSEKKKELQSNLSLIVSLVSLGAIILNILIK